MCCLCFTPCFLEVQFDLLCTFNGYLLVFLNGAVERHFLQANRQSRQSNAEAFRAVKVQPLIHCLTMSSRKLCVGQTTLFPINVSPFQLFLFSLFPLSLFFSLNRVWKPRQLKTEFLIKLRLNLHFSTWTWTQMTLASRTISPLLWRIKRLHCKKLYLNIFSFKCLCFSIQLYYHEEINYSMENQIIMLLECDNAIENKVRPLLITGLSSSNLFFSLCSVFREQITRQIRLWPSFRQTLRLKGRVYR